MRKFSQVLVLSALSGALFSCKSRGFNSSDVSGEGPARINQEVLPISKTMFGKKQIEQNISTLLEGTASEISVGEPPELVDINQLKENIVCRVKIQPSKGGDSAKTRFENFYEWVISFNFDLNENLKKQGSQEFSAERTFFGNDIFTKRSIRYSASSDDVGEYLSDENSMSFFGLDKPNHAVQKTLTLSLSKDRSQITSATGVYDPRKKFGFLRVKTPGAIWKDGNERTIYALKCENLKVVSK